MVRLLLVEDDPDIRRTLARGLSEQGASVVSVATAVEAIKAVGSERPDAMVLDLGLPDLDGSDVLALVRATSDVPVVVGVVMVVAVAYILMTIATDVASRIADPRPRTEAGR